MYMEMEDGLPAVGTGVRDQTIASPGNPLLLGELARRREKMPNELLILRFQRRDRFDVPVWNDQDMGWRDGMRIPKGSHLIVLIKNCGLRFPGNDPAKNTCIGHF